MIPALLITLREGLEAALIVGIVLATVRKLGHVRHYRAVWYGVVFAIIVSGAAGAALTALHVVFEGRGEEIFEGVTMLLAAAVLTWAILWMQRQGSRMASKLGGDLEIAITSESSWALFALVFLAVLREGIETALFLLATTYAADPIQAAIGAAIGLGVAVLAGFLIFTGGKRLNVRTFFRVAGVLLLLFAAGLVAHGIHELQEAQLLPTVIEHAWDVNHVLDEESIFGSLLKAVFGYNANPSLLEVLGYSLYIVGVGCFMRRRGRTSPTADAAAT